MRVEGLKDGTMVELRPLGKDDLQRSLAFFRGLPAEERRYLRFDVTAEDVVRRLIRQVEEGQAFRVVALVDERVVGHGALELPVEGWTRHMGELRIIVAPEYRNRRLGTLLIGYLFRQAVRQGLQKLEIRMAGPQLGARSACERLGFHVDAVLPDHVKDADGNLQPLVVMTCAIDEASRSLRQLYADDSLPDG